MHMFSPCISILLQPTRREFACSLSSLLTLSTSDGKTATPTTTPLILDGRDYANIDDVDPRNNEYNPRHGTKLQLRSVASNAHSNHGLLGPMAKYPDPILRHTASPVTEFDDPDLDFVVDLLLGGMKTNSTTALQYGIDARIVILRGPASPLPFGTPLVLINPNVLSRSSEDKMVSWIEYCGDIPVAVDQEGTAKPLEVELLRDEVVEVAAQDIRGLPIRKALGGKAARAFQHELDHLDGLLIIDHSGLDELPESIAREEAPYHAARQRRAFERRVYQGNGPLYW